MACRKDRQSLNQLYNNEVGYANLWFWNSKKQMN